MSGIWRERGLRSDERALIAALAVHDVPRIAHIAVHVAQCDACARVPVATRLDRDVGRATGAAPLRDRDHPFAARRGGAGGHGDHRGDKGEGAEGAESVTVAGTGLSQGKAQHTACLEDAVR